MNINSYVKIEKEAVAYTGFFYEILNSTALDDEARAFHEERKSNDKNGKRMLKIHDHIMDSKNVEHVKWKSRIHDPW